MSVWWLPLSGLLLLLGLITLVRLNAFIALVCTALYIGLAGGLDPLKAIASVQNGMGSTLGPLALVLGLGAILGKMLSDSGAAQRISDTLLNVLGNDRLPWVMMTTGFLVGLAMFYNAGFIVLLPLMFSMARRTKRGLLYAGLPVCAALSVTHGFIPPHPSPSAIAVLFHANMGKTVLLGITAGIPAILVAGLILPQRVEHFTTNPPAGLFEEPEQLNGKTPGFGLSLATALAPALLMGISAVIGMAGTTDAPWIKLVQLAGDPGIALLLTVLFALWSLGIHQGQSIKTMLSKAETAVGAVAMILLIIGGGGALKQALTDTGAAEAVAGQLRALPLSPLLLGWLVAAFIRIAIGSATVAGLTAAGIIQPLLTQTGISPELMVLSIGAGSLAFSHVNDSGFWLFKESFGLSLKDTFRSWTLMETLVSVTGLIVVLFLSIWVK